MKCSKFRWAKGFALRSAGPALAALALLMVVATPADLPAKRKSPFSTECSGERGRLKTTLSELFLQPGQDGDLRLRDANEVLARHPLLATIGLDIYLHDRDTRFLKALVSASTDYANFMLAQYDRDGDFLLERTSGELTNGLEDVGYNALFVLDLFSLSRLCSEANQPVDALFWYQGARTISRGSDALDPGGLPRFFLGGLKGERNEQRKAGDESQGAGSGHVGAMVQG